MKLLERIKAYEALNNQELIERMVAYKNRVKRSGCPNEIGK